MGGILDTTVVAAGWVSQWIIPFFVKGADTDFKSLQVLKVVRCLRCVRILRVPTIFHDLWIVVSSFFECLTSLRCRVCFILIILFIFAIFGVEVIGLSGAFTDTTGGVRFSGPLEAMLCLFQIMTLDNWANIVMPL